LLIAFGIALLWFSRFQRTGKLCVSLGWLLLLLLSLQPVADSLLKPIEDKYPTWRGEKRAVRGGAGRRLYLESGLGAQLKSYQQQPAAADGGHSPVVANPGSKMIFTGAAAKRIRSARQKPGPEWQRAWAYRAAKSSCWINPKIPKRKPLR
jgi:uncharacterized SAM-binding protein YcdF (DUF218 family)